MPWRGDQQRDCEGAGQAEPTPRIARAPLADGEHVERDGARRQRHGHETLEQQSDTQRRAGPAHVGPRLSQRALLRAQETREHKERRASYVDVRDPHPGEQEQPATRGKADAGVESGQLAERPAPDTPGKPAQQHGGQSRWQAGRPVVHAEHREGQRDRPHLARWLVEVRHSVETRRDPVPGLQHVARDLGVGGVHVVEQGRRTRDRAQEGDPGDRHDKPAVKPGARQPAAECAKPGTRHQGPCLGQSTGPWWLSSPLALRRP